MEMNVWKEASVQIACIHGDTTRVTGLRTVARVVVVKSNTEQTAEHHIQF